MKIAVVGTGYVGLVAGTCFAETGNDVVCVDIDAAKVAKLSAGESPIYEPGLAELLERNIADGRLSFTTNLPEAVQSSKVIFLAVGTPSSEDGSADLTAVMKVAEAVGDNLNGEKIIVNKSTVPVGTAAKVQAIIASRTDQPVHVVSNPEFLKEGSAIEDFLKPDRVVIGTSSDEAWEVMNHLYRPFVRQGNPIVRMSNVSAEITKYAANAMLATKISFINEISQLCDAVGGDVDSVRRGITTDSRIGRHFLYPGPGYGGSCFPKDVKALLKTGASNDIDLKVVRASLEANDRQKKVLGNKIYKHFNSNIKGKKIAVWGLAFKPNTDDMREAPSITLIDDLIKWGATVSAYDPIAQKTGPKALAEAGVDITKLQFTGKRYEALEGADALALVTEWNDFRHPDFELIAGKLKCKVVFDGRNIWTPELVRRAGMEYYGIGRS